MYVSALAEEPTGVDLDRGIGIFSRASVAGGARECKQEDVRPATLHRLYRATAWGHWVLDPAGHPVYGRALDHRTRVAIEASRPET